MLSPDALIEAAVRAREYAHAQISEWAVNFKHIAVVADTDSLTPPCGACRQILWEFCGDVRLTLANLTGRVELLSLKQIFPRPFDASYLLRD